MKLIKTSLLSGIAVVVKMATLLGINKVLAIYVGPTGYAALGQFQNAVQMITSFSSGAINTGVTKYTAEYHEDEIKQRTVWRTAGTIVLLCSTVAAILIAIFNKNLAVLLLKNPDYSSVFLWLAASLIFFTFNSLLVSVLNGKKEIAKYVTASIVGSVFSLIVTAFMSIQYGLYGTLVALAIYQSLSFFVTLTICYRTSWFKVSYFFGGIDKTTAINFSKYTAIALTSAVCIPLAQVTVRSHIGETLGWDSAGYWEAMWRLSGAYLMLVTTTLSVYYLPRLSEIKDFSEIKKEIILGYKIILPVAAVSGLVIYLLRDFIVGVLFTKEFLPMRDLFAWQMVGDTLKIASWLLSYVMLSKAMVKFFILTEVISTAFYVFLVYVFTSAFGIEGTVMAYALNYFLYLMFIAFYFNGIFKKIVLSL